MTATNRKEKPDERQIESAANLQEPFINSGDAVQTMLITPPIRNVEIVQRDPMERWLNNIHCGDCVKLMNEMPAASVSLIVTSSPYNLRNSTDNGMRDGLAASGKMNNS